MASYTINNQNAANSTAVLSSSYKTLLSCGATTGATTLRRIWITEMEWGATDVPNSTDCPILLDMSVYTAIGTGNSLIPVKTDNGGGDANALGQYNANFTGEPTYTSVSSVFFKSINQRASDKQWWRDQATCPISPAITISGFGMRFKSPNYASTMGVQASVIE
jgi:hypothetical protein